VDFVERNLRLYQIRCALLLRTPDSRPQNHDLPPLHSIGTISSLLRDLRPHTSAKSSQKPSEADDRMPSMCCWEVSIRFRMKVICEFLLLSGVWDRTQETERLVMLQLLDGSLRYQGQGPIHRRRSRNLCRFEHNGQVLVPRHYSGGSGSFIKAMY